MKAFVSNLTISVVSLFAAMAAGYALLVPQDFALRGLAWVALALAAIALSVAAVVRTSPRSMVQVLDDVDHEQAPGPSHVPGAQSRRKERP